MNNKAAIFIFTNDRINTLKEKLDSIQNLNYVKYIIDDSITSQNQKSVMELCNQFPICNYIRKEKFNASISQHQIEFPKHAFLLRELGSEAWNLGYSKNFTLLFSKSLGLEKVLFMNDDIKIPNLTLIEELFQSIDKNQNTNAKMFGLVDDSVFGQIDTALGIQNKRLLANGLLVFDPQKSENFFFNNYNDDWIWFCLQSKDRNCLNR